ncbi:MAG: hypothetical protein K8J08_10320 [Thermoanaerobaculia bacterium]|nr:hypothetical protein [Thermoanaerobaculia bacterium]
MTDIRHPASSSHDPSLDRDIAYRFLLKVWVGSVVAMVLVCAFIYWLYFVFLAQAVRADPPAPILNEASERIMVPGPNLLANPEFELQRLNKKDQARLDEYGWVDEGAGVARVPIDRALDMVVEQEARRAQQASEASADPSIEVPIEPDVPAPTDNGGSE